jgi:predicted 2-oxoglutarate/Fe(II)-dependent dioxygenase YbiX
MSERFIYWYFKNIIPQSLIDECLSYDDFKIAGISLDQREGETIVDNYRNAMVNRLDPRSNIGQLLKKCGDDANLYFNFDLDDIKQLEVIRYTKGGKYDLHQDFISNYKDDFIYKLTILGFLNKDFVGGEFYLLTNRDKFYVDYAPGDVIVFPTFTMHCVEPVIVGNRYSVVTWYGGKPWR